MWKNEQVDWIYLEAIGELCHCGEIPKELVLASGDIPLYRVGTIGKQATEFISQKTFEEYRSKYPYPKKGDVLITVAGTIGKLAVFDGSPSYFQGGRIKWLRHNEEIVLNKYLYYYYQKIGWQNWEVCQGKIAHLPINVFYETLIPCPRFEVQKYIIVALEKFEALMYDETASLQAEIKMNGKRYEYYKENLIAKLKENPAINTVKQENADMPLLMEAV